MPDHLTYARDVTSGRIPASDPVIGACRRSLRDHADPPDLWVFDQAKADRVIAICRNRVTFEGGSWAGKPFIPLPWQEWLFSELFGWVHCVTGRRRFRKAVICTGKASGKNTMLAAVALILCVYDNRQGSQVIIAAASREQARIPFSAVAAIIEQNRLLKRRVSVKGGAEPYLIVDDKTRSWIRRVANTRKASGYNLHGVIIDELHEHQTPDLKLILEAGMKESEEPLCVIATNAGEVASGHAWEEIQMAEAVAMGAAENDRLLPFIARINPDVDDWDDEACWIKANPSLPDTPSLDYLRGWCQEAKASPTARAMFRRLALGLWESVGEEQWMAPEDLEPCFVAERPEWVDGQPCYLAADLARRRDMTAMAAVWKHPEEDRFHAECIAWMPAHGLTERQKTTGVPFRTWVENGSLVAAPGRILDLSLPAAWVGEMEGRHGVEKLAADPYFFRDFAQACRAAGVTLGDPTEDEGEQDGLICTFHSQGWYVPRTAWGEDSRGLAMAQSIVAAEDMILGRKVTILENPTLRAAVFGAMVILDGKANKMFTKKHAKIPIDSLVATVMAMGCASVESRAPADDLGAWLDYMDRRNGG